MAATRLTTACSIHCHSVFNKSKHQVIGYSACREQLHECQCSRVTVPSCSADLGQDNLIGAKSIIATVAVQVGSLHPDS